jgi:hypothetical protein
MEFKKKKKISKKERKKLKKLIKEIELSIDSYTRNRNYDIDIILKVLKRD